MIEPTKMQNFKFKCFVLSATQKRQTCGSEDVYFKISKFIIYCHFCVAHRTKSFALHFFMLLGYIINYVHILSDFSKTYKYDF